MDETLAKRAGNDVRKIETLFNEFAKGLRAL